MYGVLCIHYGGESLFLKSYSIIVEKSKLLLNFIIRGGDSIESIE